MPIIPWRPFRDLDKFFSDDDLLFPALWQRFGEEPAMDMYETDKNMVVKVNLPGVDPDKIDISVENDTLRVSGKMEEEEKEEKKGYFRREIRYGMFERSVHLPVPVKEKEIKATYDKGVLEIVMPKAEKAKEKQKIKIQVKK